MKGVKELKSLGKDKIFEINDQLDMMARTQFVEAVAKDEGVTMEEAMRMCMEGSGYPKYSMGYKMASPAMLRIASSRKYVGRFKEMLTPEELEIFEREVEPMGLKGLMKDELKRKTRRHED